jgi:adenylate cyclase
MAATSYLPIEFKVASSWFGDIQLLWPRCHRCDMGERYMTYRTKLFVLLTGLVVVSNGMLGGANYLECKSTLEMEIHRKSSAIAASMAALLDPEAVKTIRHRSDETAATYAKLQDELRKVRDLNRNRQTWIKQIFILMPASQNRRVVEYAVDAEERFDYTHHPGDVYMRDGQPVRIGLDGIEKLAEGLKVYQAGYRSAFAPIRDRSGALVAMVGVTSIPTAYSTIYRLAPSILIPFTITIGLTIVLALFLVRAVNRPLEVLGRLIDSVGKGDFSVATAPSPSLSGEFSQVADSVRAMAAGLRERETIKRAFSGYISRQVLDAIIVKGEMPALKGERRRVTVLFSDIRGFTSIAEVMRPEEVVELLSEFFDRMVEVILRHQGTIDKFLGDGMMVIFGAPLDDPYQEEHAVSAACEMQKELRALCGKWQAEGRATLKMGVGINSGAAVVGNIGSAEHMEYTAIGDAVNLASRLESATKELDVEIIVSENTYSAVRPLFHWKSAGEISLRGRSETVRAYSVEV